MDRRRRKDEGTEVRSFFDGSASTSNQRQRRRRSPRQKRKEETPPGSPTTAHRQVTFPIQLLTRQRDDEPTVSQTSERSAYTVLASPKQHDEAQQQARGKASETRSFQLATRLATKSSAAPPSTRSGDRQTSESQPPATKSNADVMKDGVKFVSDTMDIQDGILEFLKPNTNFKVVAAIGPQTAGKSTVLSMLGGNDSQDMYRQYIFRPASREAVETSKHQTYRLQIFITKFRMILIDCQAVNSAAIIDEALLFARQAKFADSGDNGSHVESVQLMAFLFEISHTVLVCMDYVFDLNLIKSIRLAEMIKANVENIAIPGLPSLAPLRKVNLVFLHTKAKAVDFAKVVTRERILLLRAMFSDSRRFWISPNDEQVLFPLADIKPRKENSGAQASPSDTSLVDSQTIEEFDKTIERLRLTIVELPTHAFTTSPDTEAIDELKWFAMAKQLWKEPTFVCTCRALDRFMRTDEMSLAVQMQSFSLQPKQSKKQTIEERLHDGKVNKWKSYGLTSRTRRALDDSD